MATRLLLVRHGGTVWSADERFAGSSDVPLSDDGRAQARALSLRLANERITAFYCSSMQRTMETATLIAAPHGMKPTSRAELREIDHGSWEGLRPREVQERFTEAYRAWQADPFLQPAPGGESGLDVLSRSLPEIRRIVEAHRDQTVLVVSHKATLRLLLCYYLTIDPRLYREKLGQEPCCLNILDFPDSARAQLMLMNDTWHYAKDALMPAMK